MSLINQLNKTPTYSYGLQKRNLSFLVDQIWHLKQCWQQQGRRYSYCWFIGMIQYSGHSKTKHPPQDRSHLSWNCHKPIFTTRTSRNWRKKQLYQIRKAVPSRPQRIQRPRCPGMKQLEIKPLFLFQLHPSHKSTTFHEGTKGSGTTRHQRPNVSNSNYPTVI